MPTLTSQWRAFWHTMTSNDRHADHDSPFRTGNHVPLSQNRHAPLTSIATSAAGSASDPDFHDVDSGSGFVDSNRKPSLSSPYSPGMRSQGMQRQGSNLDTRMEAVGSGEIQMQSFSDGLPPPPPVHHSWKRIDRWLEDNYEELFENVGFPATINDVNELEHELDCTLPQDVRDSLQIHDGQERGGRPTGVIFGCMLLDCEEIIQEWQNWRTVNEAYLHESQAYEPPQAPLKAFAGSSAAPLAQAAQSGNQMWKQDLLERQDSQPSGAIQKAYAHPAWIPLARDWGGNNIAVDLAPGPTGRWGQVILMGRDYDCKYVVGRSWAAFLATLADDMNTDKWFIDEDTQELKLREFKQQGVEPAYIDILRWRADQKHGRKRQAKRPPRINSSVSSAQGNGLSPYASPTSTTSDEGRGRSPQRFQGQKSHTTSSPRGLVSSPLARVTEEATQPLKLDTTTDALASKGEKLISADTPRAPNGKLIAIDSPIISSDDTERRASLPKSRLGSNVVTSEEVDTAPLATLQSEELAATGIEDEMKDVKI